MESSSKRARAPANMNQVAHCLVDGCNADLSLCRDYHRRHKVCETHSKTSKVTIGGREQRFCQQCSRFHSLVEFDEGKRSCRKRLDGHNRRRRKPQPDRNAALDFSNQHSHLTGTTATSIVSFTTSGANNNSPQILPSSVVGFSSWAGNIKAENETVLYNNSNHQMNYMERPNDNYKGSANHQLEFSSDGLNHHHHREIVGPDGALSLLSSNQSTREMGLVHHEQVLSSGLVNNYGVLGQQYHHHELAAQEINKTVVDSHGRNPSTLHFADMFQQGQEGSSTSGPHQTLTFMWE